MSRKEFFDKIEEAFEMVFSVRGRKYRIVRDEDDQLIITERSRQETAKHYSDTHNLLSRYKIDGNPLRDCLEAITIDEYTALLDA
ncbi:MAG: hypothetical protein IKZ98_07665 [Clostridia bacterium]|nr:hypothetical protein [Clostridia bacterium]